MRTFILKYELFIMLFLTGRVIFKALQNHLLAILYGVLILLIKWLFEGYRAISIGYIAAIFVAAYLPPWAQFIPALFVIFLFVYFPVCSYSPPSGFFYVGHQKLEINPGVKLAIFYPSIRKTQDVNFIPRGVDFAQRWHESARLGFGQSNYFWVYFKLSYLRFLKMGVQSKSELLPLELTEKKKFPVIIFSHGLASHEHAYATHLKEWGSRGYIVFSVGHQDEICPESRRLEDFEIRSRDLEKRTNGVRAVLDFIYDPVSDLKEIFQAREFQLDYSNISVAGHSYGGATAINVCLQDKRITGSCICLDPWMFPIEENKLQSLERPLMIFSSADFDYRSPGNIKKILKLAKLNRITEKRTYVVEFKDCCHANFTDHGLFMGRELVRREVVRSFNNIDKYHKNHLAMIDAFLEVVDLSDDSKSFDEEILFKKYFLKDHFEEIEFKKAIFEENAEPRFVENSYRLMKETLEKNPETKKND